tara:strand:- start:443 stop:1279 length:837 start_codon:yes stop_codon:yes gene_type:complete
MAFGDPSVTDFDDDAGSPEDYGLTQADFDFASTMGSAFETGGTDAERQAIANYLAQPQVGRSRSNIIGTPNYDADYAAALKISRGLNPGGIESLIKTPTYLQPQLTGQRVNARGEPVRYFSPVERYLQETAPKQIQQLREISPTGIFQNLIDIGTKKFNETFGDDEKEEKSDVGIMQNMDRADMSDFTKALISGYENNPFSGPAKQTAFNLQDVLTSPGVVNRGFNFVQPYLQQMVPENVKVRTDPIINREEGTLIPQIRLEVPLEDLGLGGLFRNLG